MRLWVFLSTFSNHRLRSDRVLVDHQSRANDRPIDQINDKLFLTGRRPKLRLRTIEPSESNSTSSTSTTTSSSSSSSSSPSPESSSKSSRASQTRSILWISIISLILIADSNRANAQLLRFQNDQNSNSNDHDNYFYEHLNTPSTTEQVPPPPPTPVDHGTRSTLPLQTNVPTRTATSTARASSLSSSSYAFESFSESSSDSSNPFAPYFDSNFWRGNVGGERGEAALPIPTPLDILPKHISDPKNRHHNQKVLQKRWSGYATVTVFVNTVTVNPGALQVVTVTYNGDQPQPPGGTVYVTVGQVTQTINNQPGVVVVGSQSMSTQTVFINGQSPGPMTIRSTSTVVIGSPQATHGPTPDYKNNQNNGLPGDRPCGPEEMHERYPGTLSPTNPTQTSTLFAIGVYFIFILVSWNLFLIRQLIYPIKLLVVSWHEFGHVVACACCGARLDSVTIDPNEGGATRMEAPIYPAAGLPAGYISSCIFGGVMLFCGFNTLASKVASFIIGMSLIVVFWWASGMLTRLLTLGAIGLLIGFWFIDHAGVLRYYVLFVGVMSCWYVLYDVMDDFVFRKLNPCCPVLFEERFPLIRAGFWALLWTLVAAINFTAWILLGLAVWRQTPRGMYCQSQEFLPT